MQTAVDNACWVQLSGKHPLQDTCPAVIGVDRLTASVPAEVAAAVAAGVDVVAAVESSTTGQTGQTPWIVAEELVSHS